MGSGKTEYSSRVWRDAEVARKKTAQIGRTTTTDGADRRNVFFIRSLLDRQRFPDYPSDALAYRGGYLRCGGRTANISNSFELERLIEAHAEVGTWIIDEASFYDERLVYVVDHASKSRGLIFIFPTLILNFRREIFNPTARLLLETATDVFPLTAYCEHEDCIEDSFYTYRYYRVNGQECPALYFDPLIVIGGDRDATGPRRPNYCTRCDRHHLLPGKEYTYFVLKPLGEHAAKGNEAPLMRELEAIKLRTGQSELHRLFHRNFQSASSDPAADRVSLQALDVPFIPEKALAYLYSEANLVTEDQLKRIVADLDLDRTYLHQILADNRRPVSLIT
jgi:thymidine kinase